MEIKISETITAIGRDNWNSCYPDVLEDYDYFLSIEQSRMKNFRWFYITAMEGEKTLGCCPGFFTDYDLAITLPANLHKFAAFLKKHFPGMMALKLACLGSPCTETCSLGFNPAVADNRKSQVLGNMMAVFEDYARDKKIRLLAFKDVPENQKKIWEDTPECVKYKLVPGMAGAALDINFSSIDEYISSLSAETRKDMRRKLKMMNKIKIERRENIDDIINEAMAMYVETRNRAEFQFEELTSEYFLGVLKNMPDRALCNVYYAEGKPAAINLILADGEILLDKFFCMYGDIGRKYSLYFLSWFYNLQYCLEKNIKTYRSGQAGYDNKLRLKVNLEANYIYFRHTNLIVNFLLRLATPLLSF